MTVSITKPTVGTTTGWGATLNTALDAIVTELNAQSGTFGASSYTYNGDGTVATETAGGVTTTYTYNADGSVHTAARSGTTLTYSYNGDGTIASVA